MISQQFREISVILSVAPWGETFAHLPPQTCQLLEDKDSGLFHLCIVSI